MANQISQLKNALGIGARGNKYKVYFSFPPAVAAMPGITDETLSLLCNNCGGFPSREIGTSDVFIQGRKATLPKQGENGGDWTATFYNDEEHKIRNSFLKWLRAIDHIPSNTTTGYIPGISTTLRVAQLDSANNETVVYNFHGVFAKSVSDIAFDGTSGGDVETFTVTFSYDYYTMGNTMTDEADLIEDYNSSTKNSSAY